MVLFVWGPCELSALINVIIRQHTIMVTFRSALEALNVNVEGTRVDLDDPTICPACHKRLKTAQGVIAHLSSAVRCQWYRKGKLKALTLPGQFAEETVTQEVEAPLPATDSEIDEDDDANPANIMQDHYDQLFDLLPSGNLDSNIDNEPGPSRRHWHAPAEDDGDGDERIIIEHPTAGRIIRMDETFMSAGRRFSGGMKLMKMYQWMVGMTQMVNGMTTSGHLLLQSWTGE